MKTSQQRMTERGAVSLFVVIFASLLMIVITLGFIKLMVNDQRQATASDVSQSAYDSAQAGVEDAKRLLLLEQSCRNDAAPSVVNCTAVTAAINSGACNTVARIFGDATDDETLIQQDEGDKALQQAYTCVAILAETPDYKGQIEVDQSNMIPLDGTGAFSSVEISWFTRDDLANDTASLAVGFPSSGTAVTLPPVGTRWDVKNTPPLLRTQFMQTGNNFRLTDFDDGQGGGKSNANTLFLYPSQTGAGTMNLAGLDGRRSGSAAPQPVICVASFGASTEYACKTTINLPMPINGSAADRGAFLRLSALYSGAHYKVRLMNGGTVVPFDRVQPEVDSTGRANDMFRRVKSRIELKSDFIYPQAAIDLEGDLCKNFTITDQVADYKSSLSCTP